MIAAVKFYSSNAMCSAYSGKSGLLTVDRHNATVMIIQGPFLLNFPSLFCLGSWWRRCKYAINASNYWSGNHNLLQAAHPGAHDFFFFAHP